MLNWIKALFTSDEILEEDHEGEYVPFNEIFSEGFLATLYTSFEKYINQTELTECFHTVIKREVFTGPEFENVQKIMHNLGMNMKASELCRFLENNCFLVWFPSMEAKQHKFNYNEKTALAGYMFFRDSVGDDNYPHTSVYQEINEQRTLAHTSFVEKVFEWNLPGLIKDYNEFNSRKGNVTV